MMITGNTVTNDRRLIISTLWIVVMFNMVFADVLSFMIPGALAEVMTGAVDGIEMSEKLMLIAAMILEIPIIMIFLSRVLKYRANRMVNIFAGIVTILFVIGGGSTELHYIFFASVEVLCMLAIIRLAWKWKD